MKVIKILLLGGFIILLNDPMLAQKLPNLKGDVYELNEDKQKEYLVGANVYWKNSKVGTVTDQNGKFEIERLEGESILIVSFIGFQTDSINVYKQLFLSVHLKASLELKDVDIVYRQRSTMSSHTSAIKVDNIGEKELLKAACCNLSESFETSPSVDVSFTDAVTGTRQIQLLGLAERYTQISRENMPDVRGLAAMYGLTFTPGTWIESIQLNKGAGSVVNGFESIAGQINIELQKPEDTERMYLNLYLNQAGQIEGNANFAFKLSNKWSTGLLLHAKNISIKHDRNEDGFLDMPLGNQIIALNRWKFTGDNGLRFQFGIKATYLDNYGGQLDFDPDYNAEQPTYWGMTNKINRWESWAKIGTVNFDKPWRSLGFQVSGVQIGRAHV